MKNHVFGILFLTLTNCSNPETVETYHPNKKVKSRVEVKNGVLHGEAKTYYSDGKLETKGSYLNGLHIGEHFSYYRNGQVHRYYKYELVGNREKVLRHRVYDNDGSLSFDLFYAIKNLEVKNLTGKHEYHKGDTISFSVRALNPRYEYSMAALGDFDSLLVIKSNEPLKFFDGDANHRVILKTVLKQNQTKVKGIFRDFTIEMINDSIGYTHGEDSYFEYHLSSQN